MLALVRRGMADEEDPLASGSAIAEVEVLAATDAD